MGMDAKANVFYGYSVSFYPEEETETKLSELGVDWVSGSDEKYLCVPESDQNFDWDYNPQRLKITPFQTFNDEIKAQWNEKLRLACAAIDMEWHEAEAGWFVVCDFR